MGGIEIKFFTSASGLCWWRLFISDIIHTIEKKNTQASAVVSKKVSQTVSADRTNCVYISCEENAGQNYNIKIDNK